MRKKLPPKAIRSAKGRRGEKRTPDARRRLELLPNTLYIFINSRCNLACRYCTSGELKKKQRLVSMDAASRAIDWYASCVHPDIRGRYGLNQKIPYYIHITGGEPLFAYDRVRAVVEYVQREHPWLTVSMATNGTLMDPEKAEFLLERGVEVAVSLDGPKWINDPHRRFREEGKGSVCDLVVERLSKLTARHRKMLQADLTLMSESMKYAGESRAYVKSQGLGHIYCVPDCFEAWTPEKLAVFKEALVPMRKQEILEAMYSTAEDPYPYASADDEEAWWNWVTRGVALSPDGFYFPSFAACSHELSRFRIGDIDKGLDFGKLQRVCDKIRACLPPDYTFGPESALDKYCHALIRGLDPAKMLVGNHQAGRVMEENRQSLQKAYRVLGRFRGDERLGEFRSEPRSKARSEICFRALDIGPRGESNLAKLRQAMDHCLYSPGDEKELTLRTEDLAGSFGLLESAGLYALLKARFLKKRLRLTVEGGVRGLDERKLRFFRDYDVFLGATGYERLEPGDVRRVSDSAGRANVYAIVPLDRSSAASLGEWMGGAAKKGFERVKLELQGGDGLWSEAELEALRGAVPAKTGLLNLAWRREAGLGRGEQDPRAVEEFGLWLDRMRGSAPVEAAYSGFFVP
ncbi:MAG: radical SAM protein [Elusimicrobiota bacterium]